MTRVHLARAMIVSVSIAIAAVAQAQAPKSGGTLNVATNQTIDTIDANTTSVTLVRTMHLHTHGQLYTYDKRYALIPDLAESHSVSADGRVWTFPLVKGVPFHDGSELTADDVVASWKRFVKVSPMGPRMSKGVSEVAAADKHTVVFRFDADPGPFLNSLSGPHIGFKIYPQRIAGGAADRALRIEESIGTGPYRFGEWKRGESLTMQRFEQYKPDARHAEPSGLGGKRTAYLDRIVWHFVAEPGAHDAGLRSGRFDLVDSIPRETKDALERQRGFAGTIIKPFSWINMMVNHHNPPMNDLRVRRAVQIGLDQNLIMLAAIGNPSLIRLAPGIAFEEQEWFSDQGKEFYNRNDKDEARRLLREAGYGGQEIVLMTTRTIDYMYNSAVVIQQQLQAIGFKVRLEVLDWAALLGHITNKDLRPKWHLSSMGHTVRHDPSGWDRNFRSDQWTPWANAEMDRLLDVVSSARDFKTRYDAFANVQRLFSEQVVNIKHGDFHGWHAHRDYMKGYKGFDGYLFWDVWLDK
jgi:peptide/nickel transport system substrate-binding protein